MQVQWLIPYYCEMNHLQLYLTEINSCIGLVRCIGLYQPHHTWAYYTLSRRKDKILIDS